MQNVDYMAVAQEAIKKIKKGAFLTVQSPAGLNTMTIGWATLGFVWRKPICMVAIRDSRHTFGIIEQADDFTISIPEGNMHEAVMYCGTKSGRDVDKFEKCQLKTAPAQAVDSPIIDIPGIHMECRIAYKSAMDPAFLIENYEKLYPEKDYHTLYFGEIQACYAKE
jgi:flavin reductase (DIM6/NTAB) family NADH-FMN oxidoreductase RutF